MGQLVLLFFKKNMAFITKKRVLVEEYSDGEKVPEYKITSRDRSMIYFYLI